MDGNNNSVKCVIVPCSVHNANDYEFTELVDSLDRGFERSTMAIVNRNLQDRESELLIYSYATGLCVRSSCAV